MVIIMPEGVVRQPIVNVRTPPEMINPRPAPSRNVVFIVITVASCSFRVARGAECRHGFVIFSGFTS